MVRPEPRPVPVEGIGVIVARRPGLGQLSTIAIDPALLAAGVGLLIFALIVSRSEPRPRRPRISRRVMPLYRRRRKEEEPDPGAPERRRQYREMRSLRREF